MLYTHRNYNLMRFHGILQASQGERFTFGWFQGTTHREETYAANTRFFAWDGSAANRVPFEIERTVNGYFEVNFAGGTPIGYKAIGWTTVESRLQNVIEFIQ